MRLEKFNLFLLHERAECGGLPFDLCRQGKKAKPKTRSMRASKKRERAEAGELLPSDKITKAKLGIAVQRERVRSASERRLESFCRVIKSQRQNSELPFNASE